MVSDPLARLDAIFHCLADRTRRAMLLQLTRGDLRLSELSAPHDMSFPAASKHVRVLEAAGLVVRTVKGRDHVISLRENSLGDAQEWLSSHEAFWTQRLNALDAVLKENRKDRT